METREAFAAAQCPGVVALIDYIVREKVVEIGSATIIDKDGVLDEITVRMEQRHGIRGTMSYHDPVFQERQKAMYFGLEWLGCMSSILPELSAEALKKFDALCASMVSTITGPSEPWTNPL